MGITDPRAIMPCWWALCARYLARLRSYSPSLELKIPSCTSVMRCMSSSCTHHTSIIGTRRYYGLAGTVGQSRLRRSPTQHECSAAECIWRRRRKVAHKKKLRAVCTHASGTPGWCLAADSLSRSKKTHGLITAVRQDHSEAGRRHRSQTSKNAWANHLCM